jgi:hypothetical protein
MISFMFMQYTAFQERSNSIFRKALSTKGTVYVESSGSIGLFYGGKCHQTYGNETIQDNENLEWCSSIAPTKDSKSWIQYSISNKAIKVAGYSLRNGCCKYICCCVDDQTDIDYCCCDLYSFSLQGSNDNRTWKVLHRVEKDNKFYHCQYKTYELDKVSDSYRYIRLVQDQEYPGCPKCMQINQIEIYGETVNANNYISESTEDDDESISIIGKIRIHD